MVGGIIALYQLGYGIAAFGAGPLQDAGSGDSVGRQPGSSRRPAWIGRCVRMRCELAAAAGVLAGLWRHPLGLAAATGIALLLVCALIMHRRAGDHGKETAPALITLLMPSGT